MVNPKRESIEFLPVKIVGNFLKFIFSTNSGIWFEKDLTNEIPDCQAKIPIEIDTTSLNKAIDWVKSQNQSWMTNPKEITTALENDHFWITAKFNGKIIGCIRVGLKNVYITDYKKVITLPNDMAFLYDIYILPEQRCNGVAKYLTVESLKFLKSKGYLKAGNHIPPWNIPSIKVVNKLGFKKVCYIRFFRIFGLSLKIVTKNDKNSIFRGGKIQSMEIPYE